MADILDLEFALGSDGHVSDEGIPKGAAVEPETDTRFNRTRQIRLTEAQDDAVAAEAKKRGISVASLIRECIARELTGDRR